jgi:hypothetical protein
MFKLGDMVVLDEPAFKHKINIGIVLDLWSYNSFSDEKVLVLLTEKMTLINMHQCYVRPYTGFVS